MRLFFWGMIIVLLNASLLAQEEKEIAFSDLNLEELLNIEVTVASKIEERTIDAPSSVTVFSRTEIQNMGIRTLDQLLNYVPGFQMTRDQTNSQEAAVVSRNVSSGQLSYHVLVLENGVRLNDSHAGGASLFTRLMALDNIKQVEVIRGPGSALYGSNAFLGVVNIVTVDDLNDAKIGVGNHQNKYASINFSKTVEAWQLSAFVSAFADDGDFYPEIQREGLDGFSGVKDPREGFDIQMRAKRSNFSITARHRERRFEDFYQFGQVGPGVNRDKNSHSYVAFEYLAFEDNKQQLSFNGAWIEGRQSARALLALSDPDTFSEGDFIGGPDQVHQVRNISGEYRYVPNDRFRYDFGFTYREAENDQADSFFNYLLPTGEYLGYVQPVAPYNRTDVTREVVGIYGQTQFKSGPWRMIMGIRYDHYNDFGDTLNPRGALIYTTGFDAKFKLMYGEAFRAPTLNELYNLNNPVALGNENLDPEDVTNYEFAWIQELPGFQSTLTYFHSDISDLIVLRVPADPEPGQEGIPQYINAEDLVVEGLEFELQAALSSGVILRATYTDIFNGKEPNTPNAFGSVILNVATGDFNINFNAIYRDTIALLPRQDAYWLANAKLQYNLMPTFGIFATAENLFDEDYAVFTQTILQGVPGRGRFFSVGASWQY